MIWSALLHEERDVTDALCLLYTTDTDPLGLLYTTDTDPLGLLDYTSSVT